MKTQLYLLILKQQDYLNPLSPNTDQQQSSPNNIHTS